MKTINTAGIALIKKYEGFRSKAYQDVKGVWTIGYGHTLTAKPGMTITEEQAECLLMRDIREAESAVNLLVMVPLRDNQFSALVSFVFNLGVGSFRRSTLLRRLNAGDYESVPGQLKRWVYAGPKVFEGLKRRRAAEADLWNTPDAD